MIFLWYPKCSTCQKAKHWLDSHDMDYVSRDIKLENPNREELMEWHKKSDLPLKRFFNTSGLKYKALSLKDKIPNMSDAEQYELLSTDGMLVKRPILIDDDKVLVGFRPEDWDKNFHK